MIFDHIRPKSFGIARKFILAIVIFSTVLTLAGTCLQLYIDYRKDLDSISRQLTYIETSHLHSLINDIWLFNDRGLDEQLKGILALPMIEALRLERTDGPELAAGQIKANHLIYHKIMLSYQHLGKTIPLGTLYITATSDHVIQRIKERVLIILFTQFVMIFFISAFISILFYQLIGRHLAIMARHASSLTINTLNEPLHLERSQGVHRPKDELDLLVDALNSMQAQISDYLKERRQTEDTLHEQAALLEDEVAQRQQAQEALEKQTVQLKEEIAERRQGEEQLRSLSQRLQLATSSARLGVWDWNLKDNTMVWDDRMFEMYGSTRETFPNSIDAWINGLHPEDRERAIAECQAAISGDQEFDTVFRVLHPDGTVKYLKANGLVKRGSDGTPERLIGINADITDAITAEEDKITLESQLLQAQKMESIGRLAGGIAHDFNNLLTVILGHSEMALRNMEPTNPVAGCLTEIHNAAERSADLTRQLLAFARKQTIEPKVLDLNEAVSGMLKMMQRLIGENIQLAWLPANNLWEVNIDPSQIDQILANLCVNAHDAIADVGKITIETGKITFDENFCTKNIGFVPGEYVLLAVSDNGCGMDKETITHIFEPFYTTKGVGKGTGLGLSTVYGIVKQNNGFINCYSEPDQGTTFKIYLPRCIGQSKKPLHCDMDTVPKSRDETLLLVDDDPNIMNTATMMLRELDYTVLAAGTPNEAIQMAMEHSGEIHLLVTDVIMPEMNGVDLAKKILSTNPCIKVLFMSGYTADAITQHGVLEEGVYFIKKPFSLSSIATKIREVLDSK